MLSDKVFCLLAVFLLSITIPSIAVGQKPAGEFMCACPGLSKPLGNAANCEEACYGRRSPPGGGASSDTRARDEARARGESEARAREEAKAAERERIAEAKRKKDKEERDAKFIRDRDEAANTLKGSTGTATPNDFGLKGSSGSTTLRGSDSSGTELRGNRPNDGLRGASPSNDPMVVDARNVPSSLPKSLDAAIARTYIDAPPGVPERIRKGFQAADTKDWKVAKAWFQDALNHDPTNIGIKRLVALCDYTYTRPKLVITIPHRTAPNPTMSATDREAYLKTLASEEDRIFAEDFDRAMNDFYLNYVPKHPELKLQVTIHPAKPDSARTDASTVDTFIKRLQNLISPPNKKRRQTLVSAVRG